MRYLLHSVTFNEPNDLRRRQLTQPRRILRNHIQHRLNIRRRAGDDAQEFHSSPFAAPTHSLSSWNSRTFSMAITAWSAKVSRSLICAGVKGRTSMRRAFSAPMSSPCWRRGTHQEGAPAADGT